MTISQTQLVDILYKKLSGVSKTDTSTAKSPANEANASPQLSPGSTIWQQDYYIPGVTTLPTSNSSVVTVYRDSLSSTVQAVALSEGVAQETWATNLTDWISPQFGAGYQLQLYAGPPGRSNPQTFTNLPVGGSGNSDSWYFDYSAGIVNFADTNVPTPVANVANVVYVVGARYTGTKGINNFANLQIGSITINGNTITGNTGVTFGGNISGNVVGTILTPVQPYITTVGTLGNLAVTGNTATGNILVSSGFFWGNGNPIIFSNYGNSNVASLLSSFGSNSINTTGNVTASNINGNVYTDYIYPNTSTVTTFKSTSAIGLPIGGNVARPSGVAGYLRYNTDFNVVEFYNGTGWVSVVSNINGQNFYGDGTNTTYTLNQVTTANGILVSINGTVQQPGYAYTVSGNQITFAQVPLITDQIDIRFLAAAIAVDNIFNTDIIVSGNVLPGANVTYNLGSPTQMWQSLYVSSNTIYVGGTPLSIVSNVVTVGGVPLVTYSNANVTAYLAAGTDTTINGITTAWQSNAASQATDITTLYANAASQALSINSINSNITAANAAIVTANSYNQTYTTNAISTAINNLINSAPGTLDTLGEIAANLASEGSAINAITNSITNTNANVTAANAVIATLAPISSPALTGTPTAPTANISVNNTQVATTAYVHNMLPSGIIMLWSGSSASIPYGWYLCNGTNGTPDLRDRFLVGAGNTYSVGATGGTADAVVPSHTHTASSSTSVGITDPGHRHWISSAAYDDGNGSGTGANNQEYGLWADAGSYSSSDPNKSTGRYNLAATTGISASASTSTTVNAAGVSATGQNLPPYYALCYIMKS